MSPLHPPPLTRDSYDGRSVSHPFISFASPLSPSRSIAGFRLGLAGFGGGPDPCCWRVGRTGLRSTMPGRLTPPAVFWSVPPAAGAVPILLGLMGGGDLCMPPVRTAEPLCSSLDDRLCTLVETRRGRPGLEAGSSGSSACFGDGLLRGLVEVRCVGFLATGGGAFDLFDVCDSVETRRG